MFFLAFNYLGGTKFTRNCQRIWVKTTSVNWLLASRWLYRGIYLGLFAFWLLSPFTEQVKLSFNGARKINRKMLKKKPITGILNGTHWWRHKGEFLGSNSQNSAKEWMSKIRPLKLYSAGGLLRKVPISKDIFWCHAPSVSCRPASYLILSLLFFVLFLFFSFFLNFFRDSLCYLIYLWCAVIVKSSSVLCCWANTVCGSCVTQRDKNARNFLQQLARAKFLARLKPKRE